MPMTMKTSKWKPEVEFQYGDCLFSETGNSDVLNCGTSPKRKPEVDLRCCGRHIGNSYDVTTRLPMVRFG